MSTIESRLRKIEKKTVDKDKKQQIQVILIPSHVEGKLEEEYVRENCPDLENTGDVLLMVRFVEPKDSEATKQSGQN